MRAAADELRAELAGDTVTFVVNRNINFTNICIVGCAFCGFGQGKRSPDAYEHDRGGVRRAASREAVDFGATEICMQCGIHPDWTLEDYGALAAARQGGGAAAPPARLLADGDRAHVRASPGCRRDEVFEYLRRRAASARRPGTAAEVLARRRARADLAEQAAGRALGRDHRGRAPRRPALDLDRDVRPHRGAVGAGRAHARRPRAAGAHRRHHRVRAALLHPVPHAARPHARDRGDLARGEPQAHRRLPPRARPDDPEPAGELGEDGPRRRDRGAALGRQRPRRHADGGEHLPHGRLLPRRAARPAAS